MENKIIEATFMTAENWKKYITILKIFYSNYKFEKADFKAGQEATEKEVFDLCKDNIEFKDIDSQGFNELMNSLVKWNNLTKRLDYDNFETWEEFHKSSILYSITKDTIPLMEYIVNRENRTEETLTLSPGFIEKIIENIDILVKLDEKREQETIYKTWHQIFLNYKTLDTTYITFINKYSNRNAEDEFKELELVELIQVQRELLLIINNFITLLGKKKKVLFKKMEQYETYFFEKIAPIIAEKSEKENFSSFENEMTKNKNIWNDLKNWFSEREESKSVNIQKYVIKFVGKLYENITETLSTGGRKMDKEYFHILNLINSCNSDDEVNKLAGYLFGINQFRHYKAYKDYTANDSVESSYYVEGTNIALTKNKKTEIIKSSKKGRSEKTPEEKEKERLKKIKEKEIREYLKIHLLKDKIDTLDYNNKLIKVEEFQTLYNLYFQGYINSEKVAVTKYGIFYKVEIMEEQKVSLICEDGLCKMPRCIFTRMN